ncbi:DUF2231 domain-containing protein [Nocardioides sp.]|uniref:DUF2231 domain-containing protein n=1 Tax=Nocardioides sp. TaxID=35761 RepID=UPI0035118331
MFDLINGLPVHPLVVHAVAVLLPMAVIGAIALVVRPQWRVTFGPLLIAITAVGTVLIPVATSSGEKLEERVGDPAYGHAEKGEQLIWFALPLLIFTVALVLLERRKAAAADAESPATASALPTWLPIAVAAAVVVFAAATAVQVYRVGDSGAKSVWKGEVSSSSGAQPADGDDD